MKGLRVTILTLDRLWLVEVVCEIFNPRCWQHFLNRVREVLEDNAARQLGIRCFELGALMAHATAYVHKQSPLVAQVIRVFLERVHREPGQAGVAPQGHVVIEIFEILGVVGEPAERVLRRLVRVVERGVLVVLGTPMVRHPEEFRECLVLRPESVKAAFRVSIIISVAPPALYGRGPLLRN